MDDDKTNEPTPPAGKSRKRSPPTIELKAANVSDAPSADAATESAPEGEAMNPQAETVSETVSETSEPLPSAIDSGVPRSGAVPIIIAAASGATAACAVLAAAWFAMAPGGKSDRVVSSPPQAAIKTDLDTLNSRIAKIESRPAPSSAAPVADPALTARIDVLEKSAASLRDDVASVRASLGELKSAPRETAAAPDLSAVEERISKIERATTALTNEVAAAPKPVAEDLRLRLVAVATSLDASVRQSEPYAATLATARALAGDVSVLKPLDAFADKGIPSASSLNKELIALLPQLAPKPTTAPAATGLLDRLQQSASKLVHVQRIDTAASDNAAAIVRIASTAQRDDLAAARREANDLPPSERAPLQAWIGKVDAREAALAASKQFAADMSAALAKPVR